MTTEAENELLTHVGAGTPMGDLLRQYWVPAALSSELKTDGDPVRLMLLGEKLIAFRDTSGRVGVMDHRCPHRCASLFFGRNEEGGLRCVYHGWKFDTEGNCIDMPNLPADQDFKHKVKAKTYQVAERAGVIYVYMGEREVAPPLPSLEALMCPPEETRVGCAQRECNWLQALEGDIDGSHFSFLHTGALGPDAVVQDHIDRFLQTDRAPRLHIRSTDWGAMYAAYRPATEGQLYYRFAHFAMPFWTLFPNGPLADNVIAQAWVPMDDTHVMAFQFNWTGRTPNLDTLGNGDPIPFLQRRPDTLPNTPDWFGRFLPAANKGNDYLIDREAQRSVSYTGIATLFGQDSAVTESMNEISDRTLEHLAPSDRMIVVTRRRLIDAAKALRDDGTIPPLVDNPEAAYGARSGEIVAPEGQDWLDAYEGTLAEARHPPMLRAAE
ncbi:MAG TPA: Rieske 2Fe-2S domain-containing protein [Stellaceae bacterium]|jgi:phenylpropionate dioxygenase-like ring-hydroxylating dioxygenase large terminal subunit|nr:Rieske 2Fe-2S domain-containing protein [Stellaceae bacterium]